VKDPLGRPRRRREDNIKMVFKKLEGEARTGSIGFRIGTGGGQVMDRSWALTNAVINFRDP